jgi:hypothetical protein
LDKKADKKLVASFLSGPKRDTLLEDYVHYQLNTAFGHFSKHPKGVVWIPTREFKWPRTVTKLRAEIIMDHYFSLGNDTPVYSLNGTLQECVFNFEDTTASHSTPKKMKDYWFNDRSGSNGKLLKLLDILKTDGTNTFEKKHSERRSRGQAKYKKISKITDLHRAYLIGTASHYEEYPTVADWEAEITARLNATHPGCTVSACGSGIKIVTQENHAVYFNILNKGQVCDFWAVVAALADANPDEFGNKFERHLVEITSTFDDYDAVLTTKTSLDCKAEKIYTRVDGEDREVEGFPSKVHRFRAKASKIAPLCRVTRTMRREGALQRMPDRSHMTQISKSLGKKLFINPIVITTNSLMKRNSNQGKKIERVDGQKIEPQCWDLIDGQHRIFASYLTDEDPEFDVVLFSFENLNQEESDLVNSSIFYDLNYRQKNADYEIALSRSSTLRKWSRGGWDDDTSILPSRRVLAARFLIDLGEYKNGVLHNAFAYRGEQSDGSMSIKSLTTYLGIHFNMYNHPRNKHPLGIPPRSVLYPYHINQVKFRNNPIAFNIKTEYGIAGAQQHGPTPYDLEQRKFWSTLVKDFSVFLDKISKTTNGTKRLAKEDLRKMLTGKAFTLPAMFEFFLIYSIKHGVVGKVNDRKGGKVNDFVGNGMKKLVKEIYDCDNAERAARGGLPWTEAFVGDIQSFGSGGKAVTDLVQWLVQKFNAGSTAGNQLPT